MRAKRILSKNFISFDSPDSNLSDIFLKNESVIERTEPFEKLIVEAQRERQSEDESLRHFSSARRSAPSVIDIFQILMMILPFGTRTDERSTKIHMRKCGRKRILRPDIFCRKADKNNAAKRKGRLPEEKTNTEKATVKMILNTEEIFSAEENEEA